MRNVKAWQEADLVACETERHQRDTEATSRGHCARSGGAQQSGALQGTYNAAVVLQADAGGDWLDTFI